MSDNKTHDATPQKLQKARKEGDLGLSPESLSFITLIAVTLLAFGPMAALLVDLAVATQNNLYHIKKSFAHGTLEVNFTQFMEIGKQFAIFLTLAPIAAISAVIVQRKLRFTPKKLKLNFKNLNPISNLGKKFQSKALMSFALNIVKSALLSIFVFLLILIPSVKQPLLQDAFSVIVMSKDVLIQLFLLALLIFGISAGFDMALQLRDLKKRNKMSQQEVKDEHKETEGDPNTKQRRRDMAQSMSGDIRKAVNEGDVVIVNPTHFAVILQWSRSPGSAPTCLEKGTEHRALRIKELAKELDVPIYVDPPTARMIYSMTPVGTEIPVEAYGMVAAAYRYITRMDQRTHR